MESSRGKSIVENRAKLWPAHKLRGDSSSFVRQKINTAAMSVPPFSPEKQDILPYCDNRRPMEEISSVGKRLNWDFLIICKAKC